MRLIILLITVSLWTVAKCADLDFDIEDEPEKPGGVLQGGKENSMKSVLLRAMNKPAVKEQIGQVLPIIRAMSPQQRLTLAALISAQIMAPQNAAPKSLDDVAHMFSGPGQSPKNVSEQLLLPISMDIAKIFKGIVGDAGRSWKFSSYDDVESSVQKKSTPRPIHIASSSFRRNGTLKGVAKRHPNEITRRNGLDYLEESSPTAQDCDFFTSEMCQNVSNYPEAEILVSIQEHLPMMEAFLTDYGSLQEREESSPRAQRREDPGNENSLGNGEGHMCPSAVKYAKPKRARTTSGAWKYIVNTGEYTQTLRLEICSKNGASCSFLNDHFRSYCQQVYNYHRLMCWDEKRGLHMDMFKVPSCCSCHIQGYSTQYPPDDFPLVEKRREVLAQQQSSGVKREIPRPRPAYRPEQFENRHHSFNFPEAEKQHPSQPQRSPPRPSKDTAQPARQNFPNFQQKPQNFNGDHTLNQDLSFEGWTGAGLRDHLVPPGPPLPLDYERPRPPFEQRRSNETIIRSPDQSTQNKRGIIKFEQNAKPLVPLRNKRPVVKPVFEQAAASSDSTKINYMPPPDTSYGLKVRGQKPPKPVFVTPSPPPLDRGTYGESVRITPKPSQKPQSIKNSGKKVNYNYHPIIDFFSKDSVAPGGQLSENIYHPNRKAPLQFNRRQEESELESSIKPSESIPEHERENQYSRPFDEEQRRTQSQQHVQGAHEWTPML